MCVLIRAYLYMCVCVHARTPARARVRVCVCVYAHLRECVSGIYIKILDLSDIKHTCISINIVILLQ